MLCLAVVGMLAWRGCPPTAVHPATKTLPDETPTHPSAAPAVPEPESAPPLMPRDNRPALTVLEVPSPLWLDAFRRQAAARADRLADCMVAAKGPREVQWTTTVAPATGQVRDHHLVTVSGADDLPPETVRCLLTALETPAYELGVARAGNPQTVRLRIAF